MKNIFKHVIIGAFIIVAIYGISWIISCGIIKLICLCFSWTFEWHIATGAWLIIFLVRLTFSSGITLEIER